DEGDAALVVGVDLERDALAVGRPLGGHRITVDVGDLLHIPPVRSHGEELAATRSLGVEDEESVDGGGWRGRRLRDRGRRDRRARGWAGLRRNAAGGRARRAAR